MTNPFDWTPERVAKALKMRDEQNASTKTIATELRTTPNSVAGAWLYGTISAGRARELAKALGHTAADIENLKFVEERNREEAHAE